jgi:enoyl-CoA hydratase/carnithine racemase
LRCRDTSRPYARDLDQIVAESEDGAEGPRAFREKRKPVWKLR